MLCKVREWIEENRIFDIGEHVVAGVSGGADSVALLMALLALREEYRLTISVVHVNHKIRGEEAFKDAEYVRQLCESHEVSFFLYEEDVPVLADKWRMSEEAAGRKYRYQCFFEVAKKTGAAAIATAHHMGDQAETVLFRLARGTGLSGGVGIRPVCEFEEEGAGIRIVRPLLCCEKAELIKYLESMGVAWREDSTNADNSYARNKIRNSVIPELEEINNGAVSHIARFGYELASYEDFLEGCVSRYFADNVGLEDGFVTDREKLSKQEPLLKRAVVYRMIREASGQRKDITKEHVDEVCRLLDNQSGKRVMLPYGTTVVVSYKQLIVKKNDGDKEDSFFDIIFSLEQIRNNDGKIRLSLPDGGVLTAEIFSACGFENIEKNNCTKVFDCDTIKGTLHVRNPLKNDYIVINENGNRKRLARYFIDSKIPADLREKQLLVAIGDEVLWHVGKRRGERYKVCGSTRHILRLSYEGGYNEGSN